MAPDAVSELYYLRKNESHPNKDAQVKNPLMDGQKAIKVGDRLGSGGQPDKATKSFKKKSIWGEGREQRHVKTCFCELCLD